jgi:hypothetical protein
MQEGQMDEFLRVTGTQDLFNKIFIIILVLFALVLLILVMVGWTWWAGLTDRQKRVIKIIAVIIAVFYAFALGWLAREDLQRLGVPTSWDELTDWATVKYMWADGFARTHKWIGLLMFAAFPIFWAALGEKEHYDVADTHTFGDGAGADELH